MMRCQPLSRASISSATAFAGIIAVAVATAAMAQDVADGERIWKTKGGCPQCHGWAGDGFPSGFHSEGNAPSLRETQLSRDQIRETIQCGRPGTPMPHFDRFAYTDKRCYGHTRDEMGNDMPPAGNDFLSQREVDAVVKYLFAKAVGRGPATYEDCIDFWGKDTRQCDPMKN